MGGSKVRFCHCEYGAIFSIPALRTLDSQPIGRGTTQLLNGENGRGLGSMWGAYFTMESPWQLSGVGLIYRQYIGCMQGESEQPLLRAGLTIALREDTSGGSALSSQSDQAVFVLQGAIERGQLRHASMVSEQALMELAGLGRTPVSEAIQRFALTHMLRVHPNRGIEIPPATVDDQIGKWDASN